MERNVSASTPHAMGTSKEGVNPLAMVRYVALATRCQRLVYMCVPFSLQIAIHMACCNWYCRHTC